MISEEDIFQQLDIATKKLSRKGRLYPFSLESFEVHATVCDETAVRPYPRGVVEESSSGLVFVDTMIKSLVSAKFSDWCEDSVNILEDASTLFDVHHSLLESLSLIQRATVAVSEQSEHLSSNASALLVKKAEIEQLSNSLTEQLQNFSRMESSCSQSQNPKIDVGSGHFSKLLDDIEENMRFLSSNANTAGIQVSEFKSSKLYATRVAAAHSRLLQLLRESLSSTFDVGCAKVMASPAYVRAFRHQPNSSGVTSASIDPDAIDRDSLEETIQPLWCSRLSSFNQFFLSSICLSSDESGRDSAVALRRMFEVRCKDQFLKVPASTMTEDPSPQWEFSLFSEVMSVYAASRMRIVSPLMLDEINAFSEFNKSLCDTTKKLFSICDDVFQNEMNLYEEMWIPAREEQCPLCEPLVLAIHDLAYHVFRTKLIQTDDWKSLAECIKYLSGIRDETHNVSDGKQSLFTSSSHTHRMLQDTQERFVFRARLMFKGLSRTRIAREDIYSCIRHSNLGDEEEIAFPKQIDEAFLFIENAKQVLNNAVFRDLLLEVVTTMIYLAPQISVGTASYVDEEWPGIVHGHLIALVLLLKVQAQLALHCPADPTQKTLNFRQLMRGKLETEDSSRGVHSRTEAAVEKASVAVVDALKSARVNAAELLSFYLNNKALKKALVTNIDG